MSLDAILCSWSKDCFYLIWDTFLCTISSCQQMVGCFISLYVSGAFFCNRQVSIFVFDSWLNQCCILHSIYFFHGNHGKTLHQKEDTDVWWLIMLHVDWEGGGRVGGSKTGQQQKKKSYIIHLFYFFNRQIKNRVRMCKRGTTRQSCPSWHSLLGACCVFGSAHCIISISPNLPELNREEANLHDELHY